MGAELSKLSKLTKARPAARTEGHRVEHLMTLSDTQLSLWLLAQLLGEASVLLSDRKKGTRARI